MKSWSSWSSWSLALTLLVALVTGCAGSVKQRVLVDSSAFAVAPLQLAGVRDQLASRGNWRLYGVQARALELAQRLDRAFVDELGQKVRVAADAPVIIVPELRLRDTGQFEGLAPEAADAALQVKLIDRDGRVLDEVTLNAVADAPLGRDVSRDRRLEAAMRQLADRYAQHLGR